MLRPMNRIELDWEDMREIATDLVAPAAAQLLDTLDGDELDDVLSVAVELRASIDAIISGYVPL